MNKSDFINTLRELLYPISKVERDKFIAYYEEIIEDYKEGGLTEQEVVGKIGSPQSIANHILSEQDTVDIRMPSFNSKILNIILLILGFPLWGSLLLAAILVILSVYIVIWCAPFITGVSSISLLIVSLFSIIGSPFMIADTLAVGTVQLGLGISLVGIAILFAFATIFLSKKIIFITKYINFQIAKVFRKKAVKL
ncbi:DUF1700 domain-containing protein [Clostridium sp.]|uniref:DUF1700 domain-containing protein n=1 Tax=Clostridium sp. TaxID=1506 RepID=UPI002FC6E515